MEFFFFPLLNGGTFGKTKSPFRPWVLFFKMPLPCFLKEAPTSVTLGRHFFWDRPTPRALPYYTYRPFFILKDLPLSIIHGTFSSMDVLHKSSHGVSLSLFHTPLPRKRGETNFVTILTNYTSPPIDPWNNTSDHFLIFNLI